MQQVFDDYPYGILVVDRAGAVLAANPTARRLLGDRAPGLDVPHSGAACELLGCWGECGTLEHGCLFDRAADSDGPLPEVRMDLPEGSGAPAVWVTASPLGGDRRHVVVELRPGQVNDRRRRTVPHWTRGPQLRIFTLGRTRVESAEGPIGGSWVENRAGQVLKYLVAERHRTVYADEIAERVWPEAGVRARQGLRYCIHTLRERLEPDRQARGISSFVVSTRGAYMLDSTRVWIDADDFERDVSAGLVHLAEGDRERARQYLERGLALYAGDFLADEPYAEWAILERDRLRGVAGDGLRALVELRLAEGDLHGAARDMARLAELDPFDVDVHRELIAVALRRGRRSEALRRYTALRHRMLNTFGEDVDFTLADLTSRSRPVPGPDPPRA